MKAVVAARLGLSHLHSLSYIQSGRNNDSFISIHTRTTSDGCVLCTLSKLSRYSLILSTCVICHSVNECHRIVIHWTVLIFCIHDNTASSQRLASQCPTFRCCLRINPDMAKRMVDVARAVLNNYLPDVYISTCQGVEQAGKMCSYVYLHT